MQALPGEQTGQASVPIRVAGRHPPDPIGQGGGTWWTSPVRRRHNVSA
jgi:hypothetical protein